MTDSRRQSRSHRNAFSLVELIVVIAVIALLMSILVPTLGRARDSARMLQCKTHLRSIATACLTYAAFNDSSLPIDKTLYNPHTQLIQTLTEAESQLDAEDYYCPSEKDPNRALSGDNFEKGNIGYFYFSFTDRPANRYLSNFLLKSVQWPRILTDTMEGNLWLASDCWFANEPTAHRWYTKGVNYVTLDGSIHMLKQGPRAKFK